MKHNWLNNFFEYASQVLNGAERSFLDLLSIIVPYCVPIIPAYLTYYHTMNIMNFPAWVAATAAFVVEVLGITSVATAIRFYRHNQRYKKSIERNAANSAPFWLAVFVYLFYIVIVLVVNVLLEKIAGTRSTGVIIAIALFTMLSFPSGVLISIRTQYTEILEEKQASRLINARGGLPMGGSQSPQPMGFNPVARVKYASDYKDRIVSMLDDTYSNTGQVLAPKDITSKLKLEHANNKGYVSTLTKEWKNKKGL